LPERREQCAERWGARSFPGVRALFVSIVEFVFGAFLLLALRRHSPGYRSFCTFPRSFI
jgi:hypothetical protein